MRLDKYLANLGICSRKESAKLAKKGYIKVNNEIIKKSDYKLKIGDILEINGEKIKVLENITILLHKKNGYVSSDIDENNHPSYKKLLDNCPYKNLVKLAGRLDVDTEGLLVLCSDGKKIHQLISPKKGKEKIYFVELEKNIKENDIEKLENGIEFEDWKSLPARVLKIDNNLEQIQKFGNFKETTLNQIPKAKYSILITIKEGKFHQIKKMIAKVNNKVIYLKRLKLGDFELEDLKKGEWKMIEN